MAGSIQERADIFANAGADRDVKAAVCGNIEELAARESAFGFAAVELHDAVTGHNLHSLGLCGTEMKIAWIDEAQGFLAAIRKQDAVADDFAVKIDVRFCDGGDSRKFGGDG